MQSYHMQKKERQITDKTKIERTLKKGKYATISMCRKDEPYIVSLSYGFDEDNNALYFHSANLGLKLDILEDNPLVCGTVVEDLGYMNNDCSHKYRSVVFWGEMIALQDIEEKSYVIERELVEVPGGIESEEEERTILDCNIWVIEQGLPEGEILYELTDENTGELMAILDLAWTDGLQERLSQPVALLINEGQETIEAVNRTGFRYFTDVCDFKKYVEQEVLTMV